VSRKLRIIFVGFRYTLPYPDKFFYVPVWDVNFWGYFSPRSADAFLMNDQRNLIFRKHTDSYVTNYIYIHTHTQTHIQICLLFLGLIKYI